jgi:hypothetical protein
LRERGAAHSSSALPLAIIAPSRPQYRGQVTEGQGAEIARRHNEINGFRVDLDSRVLPVQPFLQVHDDIVARLLADGLP